MMLDPKLLELLACPVCDNRPPLREDNNTLVCDQCGRIYPVRDGIPELLPDSAVMPLDKTSQPEKTN